MLAPLVEIRMRTLKKHWILFILQGAMRSESLYLMEWFGMIPRIKSVNELEEQKASQ